MDDTPNCSWPEGRQTRQDVLLEHLLAISADLRERGIAVPEAFDALIARAIVRKLRAGSVPPT